MSTKKYMLQARPRSLSNLVHPATGKPYDTTLMAAQYEDTGFWTSKAADARHMLESARAQGRGPWSAKQFKFRIHRSDLDPVVAPVAQENGAG